MYIDLIIICGYIGELFRIKLNGIIALYFIIFSRLQIKIPLAYNNLQLFTIYIIYIFFNKNKLLIICVVLLVCLL